MDCDFDRLDLSTNPYLEKNLEFLCNWIDDLSNEQQKFNQYTRNVARQKQVWYLQVRGGGLCRMRKGCCSKRSNTSRIRAWRDKKRRLKPASNTLKAL